MHDHLLHRFERLLLQLALTLAGHPVPVRLLGFALFGPPARFGTRVEADALVVTDPLPETGRRLPWLEAAGGYRLRLRWKGVRAFLYPSPLYLQILQRGAVLYDPEGLLAATFELLLDRLSNQGVYPGRADPIPRRINSGWPEGPLTPARPLPAAAGREGRALAL